MQDRRKQTAAGRALGVGLALGSLLLALSAVTALAGNTEVVHRTELLGFDLQPPLPPTTTYPVQLVLDDNSAEGAVGLFGASSRQFLWFNRFSAGDVEIQEVWVFFPTGQGVSAGDDIQIVIYEDADGDPANGATLLYSLDTTVQVANGVDFSIYTIAPTLVTGGDTLVGVIPRYIESGVTPPTSPAALDTTASQAGSYLAFWLGDPPAVPDLPTDDDTVLVDSLIAGGGNWTIRAFGVVGPSDIPVLAPVSLAILSLLLAAAATLVLQQRRPTPGRFQTWRRR